MAEVGNYDNAKGGYNVSFTQYIPADDKETVIDKLTAAEIAAALAQETGKQFVESKVILKDKVATAEDGTKYILPGTTVTPVKVWKVTYNTDTVIYVADSADANATAAQKSKTVEDIAEGVNYLMDASKNATNTVLSVSEEGSATFRTITKDVTYVPAVALRGAVTGGLINTDPAGATAPVKAEVVDPATGDLVALVTGNYVKVGTEITLTKNVAYTLAEGASLGLKVNGKDAGVAINATNKVAKATVTNNDDSTLTLVAVENAVDTNVTVTLDGKAMTVNKDAETPTVTFTGLVDGNGKKFTVVKKTESGYEKVIGNDHAAGSNGQLTVALSDIASAAKDNKIELFTAYEIGVDANHTNWTGYTELKAAGANRNVAINNDSNAVYLPAGTTIYVEGTAGKLLTTKGGKTELDGARYTDGKGVADSKYAYAYTLSSDLATDSFEALVTFGNNTITAATAAKPAEVFVGDEFGPTAINANMINVKNNAELDIAVKSFTLAEGDFNGLTGKDFKVVKTTPGTDGATTTLQFTIIAPKDIEKTKVASEEYQMILSINGIEVGVVVTVTERTEGDDEKIASAKVLLGTGFEIDNTEAAYTADTAKTAIQTAVNEKLDLTTAEPAGSDYSGLVSGNENGFSGGYKWGKFTAAANATDENDTGLKDGSYAVTINLVSGEESEQVTITVTIKGLTYDKTSAGKTAVVNAAKQAITDANITAVSIPAGGGVDDVKTAVQALVNEALSGNDKVTATVAAPSGASGAQSVTVTITLVADETVTDSVNLNVTVTEAPAP